MVQAVGCRPALRGFDSHPRLQYVREKKLSICARIFNEIGGIMTEKAVEETFAALFALTDLRQIFRDTKPTFQFNSGQKRQAREIVEKVRKSLVVIEKELIK